MSGCSSSFALRTGTPFSLGFFSSNLQHIAKYLNSIFYYYGKNKIIKKKPCIHRRECYCTLETAAASGGGGSGGGDGTVWETEGGAADACGEAIIIIFLFGFCFHFLLYTEQLFLTFSKFASNNN